MYHMYKSYKQDNGKPLNKITPGRKIGEYMDWDGTMCEIADPSLESGQGTKIVVNGGLPYPDLHKK